MEAQQLLSLSPKHSWPVTRLQEATCLATSQRHRVLESSFILWSGANKLLPLAKGLAAVSTSHQPA